MLFGRYTDFLAGAGFLLVLAFAAVLIWIIVISIIEPIRDARRIRNLRRTNEMIEKHRREMIYQQVLDCNISINEGRRLLGYKPVDSD